MATVYRRLPIVGVSCDTPCTPLQWSAGALSVPKYITVGSTYISSILKV